MRLLGRVLLVSLVLGTSAEAAATERVTLAGLAWNSLVWAFVPVLQLATGMVLVARVRGRRLSDALAAYFGTHRAWSLWIIAGSAAALVRLPPQLSLVVAATALIPAVLTMRALRRLCTEEFGMSPRSAWRAVAVHQGVTLVLLVLYINFAVALVPRLAGLWA